MSKRSKRSDPKQKLMSFLINTGQIQPEEEFNIKPEINPFDKIKQEFALHSDDAKEVLETITKLYFDSETVKKFREQFKEDQLKELLENSNKTLNVFEGLIEELKRFNENFHQFSQMNSKKEKIDKNIFDIDIPNDFWNDILLEEDIDDDDY